MNAGIRELARRAGLATRVEVGRLRSAVGAVATIDREERCKLEDRLADAEHRLDALEARTALRQPGSPTPDVARRLPR